MIIVVVEEGVLTMGGWVEREKRMGYVQRKQQQQEKRARKRLRENNEGTNKQTREKKTRGGKGRKENRAGQLRKSGKDVDEMMREEQ